MITQVRVCSYPFHTFTEAVLLIMENETENGFWTFLKVVVKAFISPMYLFFASIFFLAIIFIQNLYFDMATITLDIFVVIAVLISNVCYLYFFNHRHEYPSSWKVWLIIILGFLTLMFLIAYQNAGAINAFLLWLHNTAIYQHNNCFILRGNTTYMGHTLNQTYNNTLTYCVITGI